MRTLTEIHRMPDRHARRFEALFGLTNGQMRTPYYYKNIRMTLTVLGDHHQFCYGDMVRADFERIRDALQPGQEFLGWNEHQGSDWQQTDLPLIRITHDSITFPAHEAGEWSSGLEDAWR
jgi:hypothetical protein